MKEEELAQRFGPKTYRGRKELTQQPTGERLICHLWKFAIWHRLLLQQFSIKFDDQYNTLLNSRYVRHFFSIRPQKK